ncbi:MAG: acyl-CoA dehydrogenase family protein [Actinomycetes bacterium]
MDFDLSADQIALRDAARELLDARSSSERVRKLIAGDDTYDTELWADMAEQGWLAIDVAEDEGGLGLGFVEVAVLSEEVGRHVSPAPYLSTVLARKALAGTEWAERLAAGDAIGAIAWGDGVVVDAAVADVLVVVGADAVTAYDVGADKPAIEAAMDLTRPVSRVAPPSDGQQVGDATLATAMLDCGATAYAAELLGAAQRMLEATVDYAKVREQFGRPIGSFQAVKHRCADMLVDVEGMRSAVWYAAWAIDAEAGDRSLAASTAKAWASDAGMRVMNSALQVHGGIGFTWEHDLHLYLKRAHLDSMLFGDATYHRERIAGLLKQRIESGSGVF